MFLNKKLKFTLASSLFFTIFTFNAYSEDAPVLPPEESGIPAIYQASAVGNISINNKNLSSQYLTVNTDKKNIGLIQFDLSGISVSGQASLGLYHQANDGAGAKFNLYLNTSPWKSSINNWKDRPSHQKKPIAQLIIEKNDHSYDTIRSVDFTAAVNAWSNGLDNYGVTLERVDQINPFVQFASNPDNLPTLMIISPQEDPLLPPSE